ncbi:Polypeptide N-acetylgalactosaminyltransferase 3 [Orchesella cincta]|uniref:Polypeptide N-acetylgalactosaminyltransferase n=1 Tax=Orchesella cincta TaxID=48709 RepID=A0A1D2MSE8_ORCCI|nr:Polypeptide N-acetylgalactosaminyltransferase 3 [Orchesella cincta]
MNKLFQINRFNLMASDRIPLNRSLPDVRRKECKGRSYQVSQLPTTSVIIVFHNEAWSTLMRTVYSVINRSPRSVLTEIILVDDASQRLFLKESLDAHIAQLPVPVKVLRTPERIGLIQARLLGAKQATGQVLTFLDAHCECTEGWLEPLLDRIRENRQSIVSPVIDIINDETFQYVRSFELHQGGFNWHSTSDGSRFRWISFLNDKMIQRSHSTRAHKMNNSFKNWYESPEMTVKDCHVIIIPTIKTPVIAGGLFSIDKDFFYKLGAYDEQMKIWGGENHELSFRGWMCGAVLEIAPCSHVGHLFRKSSPYTFPGGVGDTLNSNLARVAMVWMDEWKDFFFKIHPEIAVYAHNQSIEDRLILRHEKLQCKSFKWYLENIWPSHFMPFEDRFFGKVRNVKSQKCLQSPRTKTFGQPYGLASVSECIIETYSPQLFILTPDGYFKTDDSVCLDAPEHRDSVSEVRIMACNTLERQRWRYDKNTERIIHTISSKCLDLPSKKKLPVSPTGGIVLELRACDDKSKSQTWTLEDVKWR